MIPNNIRQLINKIEMEKVSEDFWKEIDRLAQKYEVTSDYIIQEFYIDDKW